MSSYYWCKCQPWTLLTWYPAAAPTTRRSVVRHLHYSRPAVATLTRLHFISAGEILWWLATRQLGGVRFINRSILQGLCVQHHSCYLLQSRLWQMSQDCVITHNTREDGADACGWRPVSNLSSNVILLFSFWLSGPTETQESTCFLLIHYDPVLIYMGLKYQDRFCVACRALGCLTASSQLCDLADISHKDGTDSKYMYIPSAIFRPQTHTHTQTHKHGQHTQSSSLSSCWEE